MPQIATRYGPTWAHYHPEVAYCVLPDKHPARVRTDNEGEFYKVVHESYDRGEIPVAAWPGHAIPRNHMPEQLPEETTENA